MVSKEEEMYLAEFNEWVKRNRSGKTVSAYSARPKHKEIDVSIVAFKNVSNKALAKQNEKKM